MYLVIYKILRRNEQEVYVKVYVRYMIGTCLANMYLPCSHDILGLSRGLRYMFEQKSDKNCKKEFDRCSSVRPYAPSLSQYLTGALLFIPRRTRVRQ